MFKKSWQRLFEGALLGWIEPFPSRTEECLHGRLGRKWTSEKTSRRIYADAGNAPVIAETGRGDHGSGVLAMKFKSSRRRKAG